MFNSLKPQGDIQVRRESVPKTLCFYAHKGGVGKTCLVLNTLDLCVRKGKNVILLDLDPQMNSTYFSMNRNNMFTIPALKTDFDVYYEGLMDYHRCFLRKADERNNRETEVVRNYNLHTTNIYDVLNGEHLDDVGMELNSAHGKFRLLGSHPMLNDYESHIGGDMMANLRSLTKVDVLRNLLLKLSGKYDCILMDLSPSSSFLNQLVILNSQFIVLPCTADEYAHYAVRTMSTWINTWKRRYYFIGGEPKILSIVYNKYKVNKDKDCIIQNGRKYFMSDAHKGYIKRIMMTIETLKKDPEMFDIVHLLDHNKIPLIRDCLSTMASLQSQSKTFIDDNSGGCTANETIYKARAEFLIFWNIICDSFNWEDIKFKIPVNAKFKTDKEQFKKSLNGTDICWELTN